MSNHPRNRSGEYRRRLNVQDDGGIPGLNEYNETVALWRDVVTIWGAIRQLSTKEADYAQQIVGTATHEIRTRTKSLPDGFDTATFRFVDLDSGFVFRPVGSINDVDERDIEARIMCLRVAPGYADRVV